MKNSLELDLRERKIKAFDTTMANRRGEFSEELYEGINLEI